MLTGVTRPLHAPHALLTPSMSGALLSELPEFERFLRGRAHGVGVESPTTTPPINGQPTKGHSCASS